MISATNYNYDRANRIIDVDGVEYSYDNNGNLKNDGLNAYDYDSANRLKTLSGQGNNVTYQYNDYGFGQQTTSDPTSGTGDYTELTYTYKDGSQKTFPNEEVAIKGLAASGLVSTVCSGIAVLVLTMLAAIIGGRLVKPKTT